MTAPLPLLRKLHALSNRVDEWLGFTNLNTRGVQFPQHNFDPLDVRPFFDRWIKIREDLIAYEPELADLPQCVIPTPSGGSEHEGRGTIRRPWLERLAGVMRDARDILEHPSRQVPQVSLDREGIFVGGQPFDAMVAVTSILRAATNSITLVDGYVSEVNLHLLGVKGDLVVARVLTSRKSADATFVTHAKAFIAQYAAGPPLEVRTTAAFHDRFIVIDDSDCYHFGASIKDAAKRSAFMFSRIEEPAMVAFLKETIAKEWASATIVALS